MSRCIARTELGDMVATASGRWPSAGLAVAVVRDGAEPQLYGYGVADVPARTPVTRRTVFRIGSVTKTFTAIAVLQLVEEGLLDLDGPVADHLRCIRLLPARSAYQPVTARHLLTHTAGIGYWRRLSDLLQPGVGSGDRAGPARAAPLADYYRRGLPVEVEPGTKWVYSNHGFAVLGQLVEDVTGEPVARYLAEHVFAPLGLGRTGLVRTPDLAAGLATGYVVRGRGLRPVADRAIPTPAAGGAYATCEDLARYVAVLLGASRGFLGTVLRPETLATMFEPHFRADPRVPGMGLGFFLGDEGGHRTVAHDGIVSGFLTFVGIAPDDGIGVVVLGNTGGLTGRGAPQQLGGVLLRRLLGLPAEEVRRDVPQRPEVWGELCGWYEPGPGRLTNLFTRALIGAGLLVVVRDGHLVLQPTSPLSPM